MPAKQKIVFISCICFLFFLSEAVAGSIKGQVNDETGEPAIGVIVSMDNTSFFTVTGLDGSFILKSIPAGNYTLKISLVSYQVLKKQITVDDSTELKLKFSLMPVANTLHEAVIVGINSGATDEGARNLEKNSDNIVNILSGKTIQLMPDVTVANVLRRVSGVVVSRGDNGEGRYPVIRGMDKRYNYTLVNGIKIPSPDNKNRYVPMDVFPSEILQRLEVIKALRPDMEGDAIGGVMNLVMKDAPDHFIISSQAAIGYSQLAFNQPFTTFDHAAVQLKSPAEKYGADYQASYSDFSKANLDFKKVNTNPDGQFNLTLGNRFFKDKLGLIASLSWQSTNRMSKETFFEPTPQPNPTPAGNEPAFSDFQIRNYSIHDDRVGFNTKIDYKINPNHKISFYTVLMDLNSYESRITTDSSLSGRSKPGTGAVEFWDRSKTTLQNIYNSTLQGQHSFWDHLFINWSAVYSKATQQTPDQAQLIIGETAYIDPNTGKSKATTPVLISLDRFWQHNSDQDQAAYLNLHYKFKLGSQAFDIGTGGMYRHKIRSNYYNSYTGLDTPTPNIPYTNIYNAPFMFIQGNGAEGSQLNEPNIYNAIENIGAGYLEAKWTSPIRWEILAGVRTESTMQSYDQPTVPITSVGKSGTVSYYDILPSAHIKYKLTDKQFIHASYFASISRPGFFEIVPYVFPGEYYTEIGNYNLKHVQADNVDLRYELFPGGSNQLLVGAFYKNIQNPIEYVYLRSGDQSYLQPQNLGTATNVGAELVFTKYFNRFGFSANYTYTHSDILTSVKVYYTDANGNATIRYDNVHRPLQGQAENIGNLSALYKDTKNGIDLQLAAVYTGRFISYLSPYEGLDYWQRGSVILDFSGQKRISKHLSIYAKCNNLLNTPNYIELVHSNPYTEGVRKIPDQTDESRIVVDKKYFGQTYLIGVRFQL
jgi:hypothetical protein